MAISPRLIYVNMKTRRAKFHFDALEVTVKNWVNSKPYIVTHHDDFDKAIHVCRIEDKVTPELIPMLIGDFVCCLRAALDQLAWALAHLDPARAFAEREERRIQFPISRLDNGDYRERLSLFPPAVASELDKLQPYHRGNAFGDHPLWQLNQLWSMDKHRAIPCNSNSFTVGFQFQGWQRYFRRLTDAVEVHFPLIEFYEGPVNFEPEVTVEVLFGEHMGEFEVSMARLREIGEFVGDDVIPQFTRFFP